MSTKTGSATSYANLLELLDGFLCDQGHAWGLTFAGAGTGRMTNYVGTATTVTETITITATSATSFTVSGTVSGALGTATVGTPFTSSVIGFTITAGGTAFAASDEFRINTGPKWTRLRFGGCLEALYRTASFSSHNTLFDGVFNTGTAVTLTTFPATLQVEMFKATEVRSFAIANGNSATNTPQAFSLDWSDDGSGWTTAQSWTGQSWPANYTRRDFVLTASAGAHRFWRLRFTATNGTGSVLRQVRFFADAAGKWDVSSRFEYAWKAPGVDGSQEIFVTGYTVTDNGADSYNLAFKGFRYWPDLASSVLDVPNSSGDKFLLLSKTATAYWFVVNGGRMIAAARTSSVYEFAYCGFGLPYETPSVHPYPAIIAATHTISTKRWDASNEGGYRNPSDPGSDGSADTAAGTMAAMLPDGNWYQFANRYTSSGSEGANAGAVRGRTWPYTMSETAGVSPDHFRDCIDGTKPLLPIQLMKLSAPVHCWGEFDGVYWTTGFNNTAEALIRDGAIDCIVFPNVNRSALSSFCALALD